MAEFNYTRVIQLGAILTVNIPDFTSTLQHRDVIVNTNFADG